jgi:hypothetical protein
MEMMKWVVSKMQSRRWYRKPEVKSGTIHSQPEESVNSCGIDSLQFGRVWA